MASAETCEGSRCPIRPHGTTGAGFQHYCTWLIVDGSLVPIGPSQYGSVGVGTAAVSPAIGANLVCVPGSAGIYYNGGSFAAIDVMVLGFIPVSLGGAQCFPLFTIAPVGQAC